MQQVVGVVDITTLNNLQYCVIFDPVDKDGKPQLGQKKLVKVQYVLLFSLEEPRPFLKQILGSRSSHHHLDIILLLLLLFIFFCMPQGSF